MPKPPPPFFAVIKETPGSICLNYLTGKVWIILFSKTPIDILNSGKMQKIFELKFPFFTHTEKNQSIDPPSAETVEIFSCES